MVIGVIFLIISILCLISIFRSFKARNILAAIYSLIAFLVLGWFSVMTIWDVLFGTGGVPVGS
ncbi:DUF2759 family protein [Tuberibacillus calidus]|uniref:DUF2759 family protein n=1 Tax=Tuberibacillus calidus TaxID=340097 RepID=UPI0004014074|nr:DUF2759 family protein [Tuberibacillus calidus]